MGLFGKSTVTTVGTSVSRVIDDMMVPNSSQTAILGATLEDGDISEYLVEELSNSIALRSDKMYKYAKEDYLYGLPSGTWLSSSRGKTEVNQILSGLHSAPVVIEYCHVGSPNFLHTAWRQLTGAHSYNPLTNTIGSLQTTNGSDTYLTDLIVTLPPDVLSKIDPNAIAQWGISAKGGISPLKLGTASADLAKTYIHTPVQVDNTATSPYVKATYTWEHTEIKDTVTTRTWKTGSLNIPVTNINDEADYFQVKYKVGTSTYYWSYRVGLGTYPLLDNLFKTSGGLSGTFFPFVYFRFDDKSEIKNKTSASYLTSKKLVSHLGFDYDDIAKVIDENDSTSNIDQAMMIMAVPADTKNEFEQRYLFDFFNGIYTDGETEFKKASDEDLIRSVLNGGGRPSRSSIVIEDKRFKMVLGNDGIFKRIVVGKLGVSGKIGTYDSEYTTIPSGQTFVDSSGGLNTTVVTTDKSHFYRYQITADLYEEVRVDNLKLEYYIIQGYKTLGDEDDPILLIPIDRSITDTYNLPVQEILLARSLHFVLNSVDVRKLKWYETGAFKALLVIVAVIITIVSYGTQAWTVGAALGIGGAVGLLVSIISNLVIGKIIGAIVAALAKWLVKVVGPKLAVFIAIIAVAAAVVTGNSSTVANIPWSEILLSVANGIATAVIEDKMSDLLADASEFAKFMKDQTKLLDEAKDLLDTSIGISPLIFFGESPKDYYNRTIHSGNIGVLGLDAVTNYVDVALTLPKINDTLGSSEYDLG